MKESLGTKECRLAENAHEELRRLIDTTPAMIHTGRADGRGNGGASRVDF
jgi:hypothetical protein